MGDLRKTTVSQPLSDTDFTIAGLQKGYREGQFTPENVINDIFARRENYAEHNLWIHALTAEEVAPYLAGLAAKSPEAHTLWGIPFAIKDNLDLADIPTTAGCEAFAYTPDKSSKVVQQLIDAGAIPVGKTNLDQFATGLNGTRSPWGACRNSIAPDYLSGGSSSGSAVSVALGLATFSLGTDTAGSGRVPACFNNLIGLKPSRGLLSSSGLVPACRSLDSISIFAYSSDDANTVLTAAEGFDPQDAYSRHNPFSNQSRQYGLRNDALTVGVIPKAQLKFFGDEAYEKAYKNTLEMLVESGATIEEIDYTPFDEAAKLLYEGPWVAERYIATQPLIDEQPEAIFPVVRDIIAPGGKPPATALFKAQYRLEALKLQCNAQLANFDCLLTPTAGRLFTIDEMLKQPIQHNSELGYYTNFMNLLDLAAVSVPTQITSKGLPFGITIIGDTFSDRALLSIANRLQQIFPLPPGAMIGETLVNSMQVVADTKTIDLLVCGAHLSGFPLNWQLTERGATLRLETKTAKKYRMYALAGGPPFRPGLFVDNDNGYAIDVEVWSVPSSEFGSFVGGIPAPLGIGRVELQDGSEVSGFICEPRGLQGATDISKYGNWRRYIASLTVE